MNVEILPRHDQIVAQSGKTPLLILPPDKSIFHRLLIIGSLTRSMIKIPIASIEEVPVDVYATILALQSLGVPIEISRSSVELQGVGLRGYHEPKHQIHCANSGTTARFLIGLLAGQKFSAMLTGDASLSERPMKRLADILNADMGAEIIGSPSGNLPLRIIGRELHAAKVHLQVASSQMNTAILLAGLHAEGETSVISPVPTRDHSERMIKAFGGNILIRGDVTTIKSNSFSDLSEQIDYPLPGDMSSASFQIAAATLSKQGIVLKNVGLNPSRRKFVDTLVAHGLVIEAREIVDEWNELRGTVEIFASESGLSKPFVIESPEVVLLMDEMPLLAVLAAFIDGRSTFSNVGELRSKESDRIKGIVSNLRAFGVVAEESESGFVVDGDADFVPSGGMVAHSGDHRLAMAFSLFGLRARKSVTISDAEIVSISYPRFFTDLASVIGKHRIRIT